MAVDCLSLRHELSSLTSMYEAKIEAERAQNEVHRKDLEAERAARSQMEEVCAVPMPRPWGSAEASSAAGTVPWRRRGG